MQILTQLCQQKGASTLETSLVVLPVMLVCLLGFELVQAHQARHLVNLALQEAGRAAAVSPAGSGKVAQTFAQALWPLFTPAGKYANPAQRQAATLARYQSSYGLPVWQLTTTTLAKNRAQLDLIYVHEPGQAWLRKVLQLSAQQLPAFAENDLAAQARQRGLLALRLSHRVVLHASEVQATTRALKSEPTPERLETNTRALHVRNNFVTSSLSAQPRGVNPAVNAPQQNSIKAASSAGLSQEQLAQQDQALCGVLLCCAP